MREGEMNTDINTAENNDVVGGPGAVMRVKGARDFPHKVSMLSEPY